MSNTEREKIKKPVIFVAEDIPRNLQVLCSMLIKENYKIAAAGDGAQALAMIPDVEPDLILLDVMMPEKNGFEVCEELKKNPETRDIPVIFLTAKAETEDVIKGFGLGAVDYITKPFNGAELLSRVKTHLELKYARESLKELNATKDKFFSIIAHDLKNPLQTSLLFSDSLKNNYDAYDDNKRKEYIEKFSKSTNLISNLLENLLDWARSQKGIIKPHPEKINLKDLVDEAIVVLIETAKKKNISMDYDIEKEITVFADKNMVKTVLRNILANAIKFTRPGGEVKISAISVKEEENLVDISVSDNGVGIMAEDIPRLFRLDGVKTTLGTAREKGTGLGLILCKEFIDKNGGNISVSSKPGVGSVFKITLPTG